MAEHIGKQGKTRAQQRTAHTDAIETTKILKRLNAQALDEGEPMSAKALTAAQILLRKTLPDVKVIEAEVDAHLTVEVVNFGEGDAGPSPE